MNGTNSYEDPGALAIISIVIGANAMQSAANVFNASQPVTELADPYQNTIVEKLFTSQF